MFSARPPALRSLVAALVVLVVPVPSQAQTPPAATAAAPTQPPDEDPLRFTMPTVTVTAQKDIRCRWQNDADSGECRFDCFDPVIDLSSVCESVARDPKLLAIVAAACGEPGCLFKGKLIFKAPGTTEYKLHQDYIGWPSFPTSFMTVIFAIDPADAESGATEVSPATTARAA